MDVSLTDCFEHANLGGDSETDLGYGTEIISFGLLGNAWEELLEVDGMISILVSLLILLLL